MRCRCAVLLVLLTCAPAWAAAGPRLRIEPRKLDFGKMRSGEKKRGVCRLKNTGDERLLIRSIRPSCTACFPDRLKIEQIEPGKSVDLPVTYHAGEYLGKHTANVTLQTNDAEEPFQRIQVTVEIVAARPVPAVELAPAELVLGPIALGSEITVPVTVRSTGRKPLRIEDSVAGPGLAIVGKLPEDLDPGREQKFMVKFTAAKLGDFQGHVDLATNAPQNRVASLPVTARVVPPDELKLLLRGVLIAPTAEPGVLRIANHTRGEARICFPGSDGVRIESPPGTWTPLRGDLRLAPGRSVTVRLTASAASSIQVQFASPAGQGSR